MEQEWAQTKEPKLPRKANAMWHDARRQNNRQRQLRCARESENHFDGRIANLIRQICEERWFSKADIERQCIALEQTVQDRENDRWLAKILDSHIEPPKPYMVPKPNPQPKKTYVILDDDEEILSSESEPDDFVDDSGQPSSGQRWNPHLFSRRDSRPSYER